MDLGDVGRLLIGFGLLLCLVGGLFLLAGRLPWLGHLPGDIHWQRGGLTFFFPLATCVVISVILSLLLNLFRR